MLGGVRAARHRYDTPELNCTRASFTVAESRQTQSELDYQQRERDGLDKESVTNPGAAWFLTMMFGIYSDGFSQSESAGGM